VDYIHSGTMAVNGVLHRMNPYGGLAIALLSSPPERISGTSVPLLTATVVPLLAFPAIE